jgi:hypothetical protein
MVYVIHCQNKLIGYDTVHVGDASASLFEKGNLVAMTGHGQSRKPS